ncbi:hypothetical protein ACEPPN_006257 [Leptodophora sp. 'Broadleaf-Isolate-01']
MLINDHCSRARPEKQLDQIYITVLKVSIQQGYSDEEKAEAYDMLREVDEKPAHKVLADNCIRLMSNMLRRNICGLKSPGTLVKNIDPNLIEQFIPAELQYACLYWAQHYRQSGAHLCDGYEVHQFFQQHFFIGSGGLRLST